MQIKFLREVKVEEQGKVMEINKLKEQDEVEIVKLKGFIQELESKNEVFIEVNEKLENDNKFLEFNIQDFVQILKCMYEERDLFKNRIIGFFNEIVVMKL